MTVSGWGKVGYAGAEGEQYSEGQAKKKTKYGNLLELQEADVPIIHREECQSLVSILITLY